MVLGTLIFSHKLSRQLAEHSAVMRPFSSSVTASLSGRPNNNSSQHNAFESNEENQIKEQLIEKIISRFARLKCPDLNKESLERKSNDFNSGLMAVQSLSKTNDAVCRENNTVGSVNTCDILKNPDSVGRSMEPSISKDSKRSHVIFEVDEKDDFFAQSTRYLPSTKLKHRLLHRLGYFIFHIPHYEWFKLTSTLTRQIYLTKLLDFKFSPFGRDSEWLDPDDEKEYNQRNIEHSLHIKQKLHMLNKEVPLNSKTVK